MRMFSFCLFLFIQLSGIIHICGGGLAGTALKHFVKCPARQMHMDVSKMDVHFHDFHRGKSKVFPIDKAAKGILSFDRLDKNKKFYMFVHGFATYINHTTADLVRRTFKAVPNSYLILIDHSHYTNHYDGLKKSYRRSVKHVYSIGVQLAHMLAQLNNGGINPKRIHAIGHSLGGQILGHVGHNFIKLTNGKKIARITALDPAGPCFSDSPKEEQIRAGVADYVEVYHCDDGALGTKSVLGDTDFFVNKGSAQPQCKSTMVSNKCSHNICVSMWMASVAHRNWFPARNCDKYKLFKNWSCVSNKKTNAGFWNPGTAKGVYFFSTKGHNF
ncbi:lipase member H-like [Spodoptera litura]|uniref:Lipase member H-like n=1 Tax=Spodoptera litura TaxID=69820 RepID=A0A9J7IZI6_SPOLT|nr:lipase member H-like [Spodoptera litura]